MINTKIFLNLLIASILGISVSVSKAQTADEIVQKHLSALGGVEKLKSIKSVVMEGKITAPNMEIAVNMTTMHNKAWRMDIELMSMKGWMILRPDSGWVFMPFQGQTTPDAMTPDAIKEQLDQLDLESTLCNFKEKGHSVEYLGMDDVEGTECFKLKTITKSGKTTYQFIDPTTYYIVRTISKQKAGGKEFDVQADYSNYKPVDGGYIFPHTVASQNGPVDFQKITVNGNVDESIFSPAN
ncbi:MAG: hypothetical protein IPF46_09030 [Saprospiraceae bacterium]|nr:hypothetical protein [Candidatus Vicinibacter affinis]MBK6573233.1 hypothetical protein [Candidatus Vicinibacter affinis]MBK6822299.1 hypothetical protein [Candidatus Vicinibacter affinis]MBK7797858.1 hypothetical protein [Candidatus Vicinibacter affinis]MBP6173888.1 hypothetical protein [Saprospiraceae bacterium]